MPPRIQLSVLLALSCALLPGCEQGDTGKVEVRMQYPSENSAPGLNDTPFPTDLWRAENGTLSLTPDLEPLFGREAEGVASHLGLLDGFGTRPQVEFPFTGALDADSIPEHTETIDQPLVVINVDPRSPHRGQVVPYQWRYDADKLVVQGAPTLGTVLDSATTYAALATTDLKTARGTALSISPTLRALRGDQIPANQLSSAAGLAELESIDALQGRIAGLTVFTVQDAANVMVSTRTALADPELTPSSSIAFADPETIFAGPEALDALLGIATRVEDGPRAGKERWGRANTRGIAHEHVGLIATGELSLPRFRRLTNGDHTIDDGTFELDENRLPRLQAMTTIPVTVVLPAAPPPPEGYPVVIFGHGLGSSRHAILTFAEPLAQQGMAVFAIDFDGHGSRFSAIDERNNTAAMLSDFEGEAIAHDGFGDKTGVATTFEFLGGLRNFSTARDGIQQSVLDVGSLVLALKAGDVDLERLATESAGAPVLDTRRIAYLGESFGTIVGGLLAALEPNINLFVLDVPAAGIVDLAILNSPALASLLVPLVSYTFSWATAPDRFTREVSLLQAMVDAADPLTYAPHVLKDRFSIAGQTIGPRHVLAIEVLGDEAIHNLATNSLARAMGLELLVPHAGLPEGLASVDSPASANVDGQTGVIVQYGPATHGENWTSESGTLLYEPGFPHQGLDLFPKLDEPLVISNPLYETLEQVIEMLDAHQRGEVPAVRSTSTPQ